MASTGLINSPLINYFFYNQTTAANTNQSPKSGIFISVADGGNGQIVLTTSSPHTLLPGEAVTLTGIEYAGDRTVISVTSTTFNVADTFTTTGAGSWVTIATVGAKAGDPLDYGTLTFWDNTDRTQMINTYSDEALTIPNPNPIVLSAIGSYPPIYFEERKYYVVIKDKFNNTIQVSPNYSPNMGGNTPSVNKKDVNLIPNGQFYYHYDFSYDDKNPTKMINGLTEIARGGIYFAQNIPTKADNYITFENIAPNTIEGNPTYEMQLVAENVSSEETQKSIQCEYIANVQQFDNVTMTFSVIMQNNEASTKEVQLILIKYYGTGTGVSPPDDILLTTFFVNQQRTKFSYSFTIDNSGKTIGENSYLIMKLYYAPKENCSIRTTNMFLYFGSDLTQTYPETSKGEILSQCMGIENKEPGIEAGLQQNYNGLYYLAGGLYSDKPNTGEMSYFHKTDIPPDYHDMDGSQLDPSETYHNIPLIRLYNVIGDTYGGIGDFFTSWVANKVTFALNYGIKPLMAATTGTLGSKITLTIQSNPLPYSVTASVIGNQTLKLEADGYIPENTIPVFSPYTANETSGLSNPTTMGNRFQATNIVGGPSPYGAKVYPEANGALLNGTVTATSQEFIFTSTNFIDYLPVKGTGTGTGAQAGRLGERYFNFIEYSDSTSGGRGNYSLWNGIYGFTYSSIVLYFGMVGRAAIIPPYNTKIGRLNFNTGLSLYQNLQAFRDEINSYYQLLVTFNALPVNTGTAEYFEISSGTTDYYIWYNMSGSQADPAVAGRTSIEIDGTAASTVTEIAQQTYLQFDKVKFNLPDQTDSPIGAAAANPNITCCIKL